MNIATFDEWFNKEFPEDSTSTPALRNSYKEVAQKGWDARGEADRLTEESNKQPLQRGKNWKNWEDQLWDRDGEL